MSPRRRSNDEGIGCLVIVVLAVLWWLYDEGYLPIIIATVVGVVVVVAFARALIRWYARKRQEAERQRREEERRQQAEQRQRQLEEQRKRQKEERQRQEEENRRRLEQRRRQEEEERNQRIQALLRTNAVMDEVHHMSGIEFERFMADFLREQGYAVQTTKASGDRGVDLLLSTDDRRVAVQLKRHNRPVGNKAVQEAFTGMMIYKTDEA